MLGMLNLLAFAFRSNTLFGFGAMLLFSFPGPVLGLMRGVVPELSTFYKLTITRQFEQLTGGAGLCWAALGRRRARGAGAHSLVSSGGAGLVHRLLYRRIPALQAQGD